MNDFIYFITNPILLIAFACILVIYYSYKKEFKSFKFNISFLVSVIRLKPFAFLAAYTFYVILSLILFSATLPGGLGWLFSVGYLIFGVPIIFILTIITIILHLKKLRFYFYFPYFLVLIFYVIFLSIIASGTGWGETPYTNWWYGNNPPELFISLSNLSLYLLPTLNVFFVLSIFFYTKTYQDSK